MERDGAKLKSANEDNEIQKVGASLLAKAECQSAFVLNVLAHSRAGSLPQ